MSRSWKSIVAAGLLILAACSEPGQGPAGKYQVVVYRPSTSTFYVRHGASKEPAAEFPFGAAGDVPLWADFDGSGKPQPALYRKGEWLISTHADGKADVTLAFGGLAGEVPLAADLDGDGKADLIVFRAGEWSVRPSGNPGVTQVFHFGRGGDVPLVADMNGDGKNDLVVFRNGVWLVSTNRDGKVDMTFPFGGGNDRPVAGSFSAGPSLPMLFRGGTWLVSTKRDGKVWVQFPFGAKDDIPLGVWPEK